MQLDLGCMVPWVDAYGHRGLDERVSFLSPWEFTMRWQVRLEESDMASSSVHETDGLPVYLLPVASLRTHVPWHDTSLPPDSQTRIAKGPNSE
jgi:hypothetical protein